MVKSKDPARVRVGANNKRAGAANERKIVSDLKKAGHLEARTVIGSGRFANHKGDIEVHKADTVIEAKLREVAKTTTGARYVQIDLAWVDKAQEEATAMHYAHSAVILRGKGASAWVALLSKEEYLKYLDYCSK